VLTPLDDSPWHQLPTTFDHVGTSDVRFFDRFWFSAADPRAPRTLQFTIGVYQNMNVVDGGFVVVDEGRQHNLRVSRQLRPTYDTACGPLRFDVVEPFRRIVLTIADNPSRVSGELEWTGEHAAQEERHHFDRQWGRVLEDYSRYDQIGSLSGRLDIDGTPVDLDSWWACRDHSWGVRERVGIPEPFTGEVARSTGSMFGFLFFSTDTHSGHIQLSGRPGATHLTATVEDDATGVMVDGVRVGLDATFVDDGRPRRFDRLTFEVVDAGGETSTYEVEASGLPVAMPGLGYGGYDDGLGLGVHRGVEHLEHEVWELTDPANLRLPDGTNDRPVHRIQPVRVTRRGASGTSTGFGSMTFIAELPLDDDGHLRVKHP
jgi:hypothetical protein